VNVVGIGDNLCRQMKKIYLDYNASTPIAPEVAEPMRPFLAEHCRCLKTISSRPPDFPAVFPLPYDDRHLKVEAVL